MIIDSSAIVAIVFQEPGYDVMLDKLVDSSFTGIGTPTLVETSIVMTARLGRDATGFMDRLLIELGITEIPFGSDHWRESVKAYCHFGKGRHAAALNFGDCLTYAVAKLSDLPLLCKGNDFRKTDLKLVV
mgnify:CR=1 FL=1